MSEKPNIPQPEEEPQTSEQEPETVAENTPSYLELKREYKEKKRAYEEALESRSFAKKVFRLGRKNLSPEEQVLYDESLVAEKAYYQSFVENQKDKIEARLNKNNENPEEQLTLTPLLVQRHITKPERERLEAQKVHLPPKLQALLETVKGNKYAIAAAATAGIGLKGLSIMSSFGVGLAAGAGTRWGLKKYIESREKGLEAKTKSCEDLFTSGDLDALGDTKNEYYQELQNIDRDKLNANVAAAIVAITAGTSAHDYFDGAIPADAEGMLGEKASEYWDVAKEKASSFMTNVQEGDSWYGDVQEDLNQASEATPVGPNDSPANSSWYGDVEQSMNEAPETVPAEAGEPVPQPEETTEQSAESATSEEEYRKGLIEQKRAEIEVRMAEQQASVAEARELASQMGLEPGDEINFRKEGGVITEIEGQPVPESYFSEADKANIEAARMIREGIGGASLDDALDATEEALGETADAPSESPVEDSAVEQPAPEEPAGTSELSPEAQEKLDNMRAVQDAQERAQEMMNAETVTEKYEIQTGDTLSEIAEANDVSIRELMDANPEITNPHEITAGQEINIPEATGSPVYDEGVGLGGPGSEGFGSNVPAETQTAPTEGVEASSAESTTESGPESSETVEVAENDLPRSLEALKEKGIFNFPDEYIDKVAAWAEANNIDMESEFKFHAENGVITEINGHAVPEDLQSPESVAVATETPELASESTDLPRALEESKEELATHGFSSEYIDRIAVWAEANNVDLNETFHFRTEDGFLVEINDHAVPEGLQSPESFEAVSEPNAEVPDYSSTESVSGEVENDIVEEVAASEPEAESTMEVLSNTPREVTTEEVTQAREKVELLFDSPLVKDFQGSITPQWLMDRDVIAGYEPLYTSELLTTETPVISASRLDQFITTEIFNAYANGHINLPVQYVYMLDSVSGMDILEGIDEAGSKVQETLINQLKADAVLDLSIEEVQELGVASGDLDNLAPGDQIKTGEIMKLILENMAERINGTNN